MVYILKGYKEGEHIPQNRRIFGIPETEGEAEIFNYVAIGIRMARKKGVLFYPSLTIGSQPIDVNFYHGNGLVDQQRVMALRVKENNPERVRKCIEELIEYMEDGDAKNLPGLDYLRKYPEIFRRLRADKGRDISPLYPFNKDLW